MLPITKPAASKLNIDTHHSQGLSLCKHSTTQHSKQESPAVADKPVRRENMPKIAKIRRAYNVVADNTGLSSFV